MNQTRLSNLPPEVDTDLYQAASLEPDDPTEDTAPVFYRANQERLWVLCARHGGCLHAPVVWLGIKVCPRCDALRGLQ